MTNFRNPGANIIIRQHANNFTGVCNRISFGLLAAAFLWASTLMGAVAYARGYGWSITATLLVAPWIPLILNKTLLCRIIALQPCICDIAIFAFMVFSVLACCFSLEPNLSFPFVFRLTLCIVSSYALTRILVNTRQKIITILAFGLPVLLLIYLCAAIEFIFGHDYLAHNWLTNTIREFIGLRPKPTVTLSQALAISKPWRIQLFYSNSITAANMIILMSSALTAILFMKSFSRKTAYLIVASSSILGFLAIFLTGSRAPVVAVIIAGMLLLLLQIRSHRKSIFAGIIAVIILGTFIIYLNPRQFRRTGSSTIKLRMEHYFFAAHLLKKHPFFGIGPLVGPHGRRGAGEYPHHIKDYTPLLYATSGQKNIYRKNLEYFRTLESTLLTIMVEHGIFAAAAILVFVAGLLHNMRDKRHRQIPPALRPVHTILSLTILASIVSANSFDLHAFLNLDVIFGIMAGMFINLRTCTPQPPPPPPQA